jgi:hypothetical protein
MPVKSALTPEVEAALKALGSVDLTVGVATTDRVEDSRGAIAAAQAGLAQSYPGRTAVVLHARTGSTAAGPVAPEGGVPVLELAPRDPTTARVDPRAVALRLLLEASHRLGARGCAVLGPEVVGLTPDRIGRLLLPVVDQEQDLVTPYYLRHPCSGGITTGIVYPLIRALYGRRIRFPLGAEFACSGRLLQRFLSREPGPPSPGPQSVELRLQAEAITAAMPISQAVLEPRTMVANEAPGGLTTMLQQAVSQVFGEMERTSSIWQKVRGSLPVPVLGAFDTTAIEPAVLDPRRMIEGFRLGQRNLGDVWGLVHSPGTLVELKRLAQLPGTGFAMPDQLWARIVYDFSLAHHTRVMNRDHLMGALAPLYLAWLASLSTEMAAAGPDQLEDRLEQLCLRFEAEKPYLISRWRWPDRFNP